MATPLWNRSSTPSTFTSLERRAQLNHHRVWDENDYSVAPTSNQVLLIVDNNDGSEGKRSSEFYTHFLVAQSQWKQLSSFPCLNHACDSGTNVMSDLFGKDDDGNR